VIVAETDFHLISLYDLIVILETAIAMDVDRLLSLFVCVLFFVYMREERKKAYTTRTDRLQKK